MKNVVSSYSDHWLSIIGAAFVFCVLFIPGGIWGAVQRLRWQGLRAVTVLDIDHLTCAFGRLVVTDDLSLSIGEGERHVIIGPNGAGKTSLINQIGGQLKADVGTDFLHGRDITGQIAEPDQPDGRGADVPAQQPVSESERR